RGRRAAGLIPAVFVPTAKNGRDQPGRSPRCGSVFFSFTFFGRVGRVFEAHPLQLIRSPGRSTRPQAGKPVAGIERVTSLSRGPSATPPRPDRACGRLGG